MFCFVWLRGTFSVESEPEDNADDSRDGQKGDGIPLELPHGDDQNDGQDNGLRVKEAGEGTGLSGL